MLRDIRDLKITLIDIDKAMCEEWDKVISEYRYADDDYFPNVEVVNKGCVEWLEENNNHLLGIVSPANSFGLMDGGFDGAIRHYFMEYYDFDVIPIVQQHLKEKFWSEQPPEGFVKGYSSDRAKKCKPSKSVKGKRWYNNGVEQKYFAEDEDIPEGWIRGCCKKRNYN